MAPRTPQFAFLIMQLVPAPRTPPPMLRDRFIHI
jgi:hypothetical protein